MRGNSRIRRKYGRATWRLLAGALAVALFGSGLVVGGEAAPAQAGPNSVLQIVKKVDGQDAKRGLSPGDSVVYRVDFEVSDEDVEAPVTVTDVLPAEFAGWEISSVSAQVGGNSTGVTIASQPTSPIGSAPADRSIVVDVQKSLLDGGVGMRAGSQGWLEYTITVPGDLTPDWEFNGDDLTNTATFTAENNDNITVDDTAIIAVEVEVNLGVTPSKTWDPSAQGYLPGTASEITIGATQASNIDAQTLVVQDPSVAPDGATSLDANNAFRYVDFDGFDGDPTTNLPLGATGATAEVYFWNGTSWNWVPYTGASQHTNVGGVRLTYTGEITPGATVSQAFDVAQRSHDRNDASASLSGGWNATNEITATVTAGGESESAAYDAAFEVTPEAVEVRAGKVFLDGATERPEHTTVAGNTVGVLLRAENRASPASTMLDSLVIRDPGADSDAEYFSSDLQFAGFDPAYTADVWPDGATGGTLTWFHPAVAPGETVVPLTAGAALPDPVLPLTLADITGFEIEFTAPGTGADPAQWITPGALSEIKYAIKTDEDLATATTPAGPFTNQVEVEGSRGPTGPDQLRDEDDAEADLTVVAPAIDVVTEKLVSPSVVFPGDSVIVQLPTEVTATGDLTKPTEIVVTDKNEGPGTFWDAYDATAVVPPIQVPSDSSLTIRYFDGSNWHILPGTPLNATQNTPIDLTSLGNIEGLEFVYSRPIPPGPGFGTTTNVKPNIEFEARSTLRSNGSTPTAPTADPDNPGASNEYINTVTAEAEGVLDTRTVEGEDSDTAPGNIANLADFCDGTCPGIWADKEWTDSYLTSQSGAESSTVQRWMLNQAGYDRVELQDPATTNATGVGTVFEAFNLTEIFPITLAQDPSLEWDSITAVELFDGSAWNDASGSWTGVGGFSGYTLTSSEQASTLGVRLVIEENTAARQAAHDDGDIGAPAPGSGVSASAQIRSFELGWQLRDQSRGSSPVWITEDTRFNCAPASPGLNDPGCIDNVFRAAAFDATLPEISDSDSDKINLLDGVPNVDIEKSVDPDDLVAPNPGDLAQADYPTTRFTLTASNVSDAPTSPISSVGSMKLSSIRVTDTGTPSTVPDIPDAPFGARDFDAEAPGNHFDWFNVTGIGFDAFPTSSQIDEAQSTVVLWLYNGGSETTASFSIAQVKAGEGGGGPTAAQLADTIGVSVTYQGTDPATNGSRIISGDEFTMHLDVQLRATHRVSGGDVTGGPDGSAQPVVNEAVVQGQDLIVNPTGTQPDDNDQATVSLTDAQVDVRLAKAVSVDNSLPDADDDTIYEADPQAPVNVLLTATPGDSTAPIEELIIEDTTPEFWQTFEFVSFGTPANVPTDSDRLRNYVTVNGGTDWVELSAFTGDTADINGVRSVFDRVDGGQFPQGATSWSSNWGSANLPFTVQLRSDVDIDWDNPVPVDNEADTVADGEAGSANADADAQVAFGKGMNGLSVSKRAPNDTSTHQVSPLEALPWQLIFTNTGSSLLPIEEVVDQLPATLRWDGEQPDFTGSAGGALSTDPAEITVTASPTGDDVSFAWPAGSHMKPGETMTIELGLILQPGLTTGQRATNEVIVETGVELDSCTPVTGNGQDWIVPDPLDSTCGNTNYVQPRAGTYVQGIKTVHGESVETDGEWLVDGGSRIDGNRLPTGEECSAVSWFDDDYTRTPCIAYTAVGAVDNWKLEYFNVGTTNLKDMTVIDMLPMPGDRLLASGSTRSSNFRPVLDPDSFVVTGVPAGADYTIDVTENAAACYNTGSSAPNRWYDDPECSNAATNPANGDWQPLSSYGGDPEDIAGFRITFDFAANPLAAGANVKVTFDTVNKVTGNTSDGLQPTLADYATPRVAWNQTGLVAWDTNNVRVPLATAPPIAGVTVKTADLVVSKDVLGDPRYAPDTFPVAVSCTVPNGDGTRIDLDLGTYALLDLPGNLPGTDPADRQSVTVPGVPIGANCEATEVADAAQSPVVGEFGEIGRSIEASAGVNPSSDGLVAEIQIRDQGAGSAPAPATLAGFANTFGIGHLVIEKALRSTSDYDLTAKQLDQTFEFEVVCIAGGTTETRTVSVKGGQQVVVEELPAGAVCDVTETVDRDAKETTITVAGVATDGPARDGIELGEAGTHVLVTNGFEGPKPSVDPDVDPDGKKDKLGDTGGQIAWALMLLAALLIASGLFSQARRRAAANTDV